MKSRNTKWTVLATLILAGASQADEERFDVDFNAGVGARYDSNVAIVELDSSAGEADAATLLEAGLGLKAAINEHLSLKLAYDYSGTRYREFSEFDLDLHHGHASIAVRSGAVDGGLAYDRFEGVLSGDDYLVQTQVSPSIARLFGTRFYLRGAYTRADKEFATLTERDATSDAMRVDAYLLFDGMSHYMALSAQSASEDALGSDFDFDGTMGQLSWGYRFDRPGTDIRLKAQLRIEQRDYDALLPDSDRNRVDDRMRAKLALEIPFTEHVSVGASVERTRNESGRAEANLDRTVYAMEFGVAF